MCVCVCIDGVGGLKGEARRRPRLRFGWEPIWKITETKGRAQDKSTGAGMSRLTAPVTYHHPLNSF